MDQGGWVASGYEAVRDGFLAGQAVWIRPCASVSGTRCTRCTPDSNLSREYAARPCTSWPSAA